MFFLRFLVLGWLAVGTWGQLIQVDVGVQGSFYNPGTVSAGLNDIVTFIFGGAEHDVTQSTFENPCVPLPGGFSSGFAGRGNNFSEPSPIWNLQITNVSGPLWFFCGATIPTSHCASGMVGAINPPSQEMYTSFIDAAKATNPTSTAAVSFVATGQGAFATESPVPSSVSLLPTTTLATPTTANGPTAAVSQDTGSSHSNLGAIIGGAIGGSVALAAFIIIIILLRRSSQRHPRGREFATDRAYDGYDTADMRSPPMTSASDQKMVTGGGWVPKVPVGYAYTHPNQAIPPKRSVGTLQPDLQPLRNPYLEQPIVPAETQPVARHPYAAYQNQDYDEQSPTVGPNRTTDEPTGRPPTDVDITLGVLAKEVAKVLMQNSDTTSSGTGESTRAEKKSERELRPRQRRSQERLNLRNMSSADEMVIENISPEPHSTAPPIYRSH